MRQNLENETNVQSHFDLHLMTVKKKKKTSGYEASLLEISMFAQIEFHLLKLFFFCIFNAYLNLHSLIKMQINSVRIFSYCINSTRSMFRLY